MSNTLTKTELEYFRQKADHPYPNFGSRQIKKLFGHLDEVTARAEKAEKRLVEIESIVVTSDADMQRKLVTDLIDRAEQAEVRLSALIKMLASKTDCPADFFGFTCPEGYAQVEEDREQGCTINAEDCFHYLLAKAQREGGLV